MKTLTIKNPYNDSKLIYNNETGHYELTIQYVKNNFDITYLNDEVLQKRISGNSRKIYNFILTKANTANREVIDFVLNKTKEGRTFLLDVLTEQMEADIESAYNDLSRIVPVDVNNGQVIDRNILRLNKICVDAEDLIDNSASYFGFPLLYQAPLPSYLFMFAKSNGGN